MYIYTCHYCKEPIARNAQARVVYEGSQTLFYHVNPDCRAKHEREREHQKNLNRHEEWEDVSYCVSDICTD
jgi:hypothetical protein